MKSPYRSRFTKRTSETPSLNRRRLSQFLCERLEKRLLLTAEMGSNELLHEVPEYVPGELIIGLEQGGRGQVEEILHFLDSLDSPHEDVSSLETDWNWSFSTEDRLVVTLDPSDDIPALSEQLSQLDSVSYAEPNYIVSVSDTVPNDSRFDELWGLNNTGQTGGVADADIDAIEAWDIQTGSFESVVGVIDTGVDYRHPDLYENIWLNPGEIPGTLAGQINDADLDNIITFVDLNHPSNWSPTGPNNIVSDLNSNGYIDAGDLLTDPAWEDGSDTDNNGFVDDLVGWDFHNNDNDPFDDHSHGTHVSGTIAGTGNNGTGVAGVSWRARIVGLKFLDSGGFGNTNNAIGAVEYATQAGADMTSNSWGGGGNSQAMFNAISASNDANMLFIAAAGNNNQDNDLISNYPSNYDLPNVIAVAATDHSDLYAGFTSFGGTTVDLAAPGVNTLSTIPNGGYASYNGTSMATPHVAGAAALVWAQAPSMSNLEVKDLLLDSVDPIVPTRKSTLTNGRLNVFAAMSSFEDDQIAPAQIQDLVALNPTLTSVELNWTATGDDGTEGIARRYDVRYSTSPIDSEAAWEAAIQVGNEPGPGAPGTTESLVVGGLFHSTVYYFAVRAYDNVGNDSGLSNIAQENTLLATDILSDDFENGVGDWDATGLWHQSNNRFISPDHAWYYGRQDVPNYNTGTRNFGSLTSPLIDLTTVEDAFLQFSEWSQVESFTAYDRTRVQLSTDGTAWTDIFESHGTGDAWQVRKLDLTEHVGQSIQLRFFFDTGDTAENNFEGWYVEDVSVYASSAGPGIRVAPASGLTTSEDGSSAVFSVQLSAAPTSTVSISLTSTDTTEGTVDQDELIFTPENWLEPQFVTVTGQADPAGDRDYEDQAYFVETAAAVSDDPAYSGMESLDVAITNLNTDVRPEVIVSPVEGLITSESPEAPPATFTIVLSAAPLAGSTVSIDLASSDLTEGDIDLTSVSFNDQNWDIPQTVTVTGVPDPSIGEKDFDDIAYTIVTSSTSSSDPEYDELDVSDVAVTNLNVDIRPDVLVSPTSGLVTTEDGGTAQFSVVLSSPPSETVNILVASSDTSEGTVDQASLVFNSGNWSEPQSVTVTGLPDPGEKDFADVPYDIVLTMDSTDQEYGSIDPADVAVVNENTDIPPEIIVTPTSGLLTDEGGRSAAFEVVLSTAPEAGTVIIGIEVADVTEGEVDVDSLSFDATNWNTPQTVTITGIDDPEADDLIDGNVTYAVITTNLTTDAPEYTSLSVSDVTVTNRDDDEPRFLIEHGVVNVGSEGTIVTLDYDYASPVIVATPNYGQGVAPGIVRLDNVSGNSFELKVTSPAGVPLAGTSVHYVVVEEGNHELPNGLKMEAYRFDSSVVDYKNSWVAHERSYVNSYQSPVVIGQVMTSNDPDWSTFWSSSANSRLNPPSSSGFRVGMHVGEDPDITRESETIGYIVLESGSGEIGGLAYEAGVGGDSIAGYQNSPPYNYTLGSLTDPDTAIVGLTAMDGNDGGWAILHGDNAFDGSTLELAIDEDQLSNSERSHTFEQVAYFVLKDVGPQPPVLSIGDSTVTESSSGAVTAEFTVTLSEVPSETVTVGYSTADATAIAPGDYETTTGSLTFEAGTSVLTQTVSVVVNNDTLDEFDETFSLILSDAVNADIAPGGGTGTIQDDDDLPTLLFSDLTITEGNSGATSANFEITLSSVSGKDISVNFATANGDALAGQDYTAASGQLTILAGQNSGVISVSIVGDTTHELDETFTLGLTEVVNARPATATISATILDDDAPPVVSVGDAEISEGNSGTSSLEIPVQLTAASSFDVTVEFAVSDGSATAGEDYVATSGSVTIPAGQTAGSIAVTINGDADIEENEDFTVTISAPENATLGQATGTGTIVNDDAPVSEAKLAVLQVTSGSGWQTVELGESYNSMVVVGTPNIDSSDAASVVRIRNATGNSFEFYIQSTAPNGGAVSGISVHFLVIEEGVYENVGGVAMEAVKFDSSVTNRSGAWQTQARSYQNSYSSPVVVGQVMTANDPDWSVFWASSSSRTSPPTATSLSVGKHVGEDNDTTRANETVGYLVLEAGAASDGSLGFASAVGSDTIRGVGDSPAYSYASPINNASIVIASAAGMDGGNGGWPVLYGNEPVGTNIDFAFDEDQSRDSERRHTTEQVAYIAFSVPGGSSIASPTPEDTPRTEPAPTSPIPVDLATPLFVYLDASRPGTARRAAALAATEWARGVTNDLQHSVDLWGEIAEDTRQPLNVHEFVFSDDLFGFDNSYSEELDTEGFGEAAEDLLDALLLDFGS